MLIGPPGRRTSVGRLNGRVVISIWVRAASRTPQPARRPMANQAIPSTFKELFGSGTVKYVFHCFF